MRKLEPLAALGMWAVLGIVADGMETTQMIWPGWSEEVDGQESEDYGQTEGEWDYDVWWGTESSEKDAESETGKNEEKEEYGSESTDDTKYGELEWRDNEATDNGWVDNSGWEDAAGDESDGLTGVDGNGQQTGEQHEKETESEVVEKKIRVSNIHLL